MELFQQQVHDWAVECFGPSVANDAQERNHRFLEEALELVQACGCTEHEAHDLVNYVFRRPVGEKGQEVGGVMVTLAALCAAQDVSLWDSAWKELQRIWGKIDQIRSKQASKPKGSALPGVSK